MAQATAPLFDSTKKCRRRPHLVSDVGRTGGCLQADNQEGQILGRLKAGPRRILR